MSGSAGCKRWLLLAACSVVAACSTSPVGNRTRIVDMPLAASHADLMFTVTTGSRQQFECLSSKCPKSTENDPSQAFALQVQRVSRKLQAGALGRYPDLAQRVPSLADGRFDIYVVDSDEPGSASSANGRIAVSSALASWRPSDDWLAFLIAREMGHVIARHPEENSVASMATSMVMNLVLPGSFWVKSAVSAGGGQLASNSQRDVQEEEADAIALDLLKASGYRSRNVATALQKKVIVLDDSRWSKSFRRSSEFAIAESRGKKMTVAAVSRKP